MGFRALDGLQDILILAKTYPEISTRYTETVCTAGILKATLSLVRLYPIRYRYLSGELQFKKYQWIKARISRPDSDSRPESFKLVGEKVEMGKVIGTKNGWAEREKWVINQNTLYGSVEALRDAQKTGSTSLGIVRPKEILGFSIEPKPPDDIKEAEKKKASVLSQDGLFEQPKDIELLPFKMILSFRCDNPKCGMHNMSILDWEFGQLYRKVKKHSDWEDRIRNKVMTLCGPKRDPHLILGNMARWPNIFCVLGIFHPPRTRQRSLF